MRYLVTPIIPEQFHRRALVRIAGHVPQVQSSPGLAEQLGHEPRAFRRMNLGSIGDDDHPAFAASRAHHALFNQLTERFRIVLLGPDTNDLAVAPIRGSTSCRVGGRTPSVRIVRC
jgi:hypothetical protein